jgi:hypothetical protein
METADHEGGALAGGGKLRVVGEELGVMGGEWGEPPLITLYSSPIAGGSKLVCQTQSATVAIPIASAAPSIRES